MGAIVNNEAKLLGEVGGVEGVWERDLVWVHARLGRDFLEGEYKVEVFLMFQELGLLGL